MSSEPSFVKGDAVRVEGFADHGWVASTPRRSASHVRVRFPTRAEPRAVHQDIVHLLQKRSDMDPRTLGTPSRLSGNHHKEYVITYLMTHGAAAATRVQAQSMIAALAEFEKRHEERSIASCVCLQ